MRIAALMPTRDRAATAHRAASTFLSALSRVPLVEHVSLVIVDDSTRPQEMGLLRTLASDLDMQHEDASVVVVRTDNRVETTIVAPGGGPGAARNFGLTVLRETLSGADVTIMFDDDVAFADVGYRGIELECDGTSLLREALFVCEGGRAIAGCDYVGRQDLSILEHARLDCGPASLDQIFAPAVQRSSIENVAPGGISTAFLAIAAPPAALPAFPEHYNEDYVWLHAFERAGWPLRRITIPLIHAPPGEVIVTPKALSFQIYGEIVWLAVLETVRFPVDDPDGIASAIEEIAGDLRDALSHPGVVARHAVTETLDAVLMHYETLEHQISSQKLGPAAARLIEDIRRGIALRPKVA